MQERYEVKISGKAKEDLRNIITYINETLNEPTIAKKICKSNKRKNKITRVFSTKICNY